MSKFFVKTNQIQDNIIEIINSDVNHIKNVLRLTTGEEIEVGNNETAETFICRIEKITDEKVICRIMEKLNSVAELPVKITVFQGLPKFDKMEWIIQKCTEIGVFSFVPTKFERCIVKLNQKDEIKKIERWKKIAEVASKQSGRDIVPQVKPLFPILQFQNIINDYDEVFVAYENEDENTLKERINKIKQEKNKNIAIIIGPEGGISEKEIEFLKEIGVKSVSLGKRILRTETAPIVFSSILMYELENE